MRPNPAEGSGRGVLVAVCPAALRALSTELIRLFAKVMLKLAVPSSLPTPFNVRSLLLNPAAELKTVIFASSEPVIVASAKSKNIILGNDAASGVSPFILKSDAAR
jgi:hypothetical protein